jgi:plastin-1
MRLRRARSTRLHSAHRLAGEKLESGVSLSEACASGLLMLSVADHLRPGTVDWARVQVPAPHKWQRVANCAEALATFNVLGFKDAASVVKPADLALGAVALRARALLWLLMRQAMLRLAGTARGGGSELLAWANRKVAETAAAGGGQPIVVGEGGAGGSGGGSSGSGGRGGGNALRITRFDDPKLHNGFYLLSLLRAIAPAAVEARAVHLGATTAHAEANAKLLVPSAQALLAAAPLGTGLRRASVGGALGGTVFATWEDVVECRPKMLLCLLAALKCEDERRAAEADRAAQHAAMRHGSRAVIGRSTDSLSGGVSPR